MANKIEVLWSDNIFAKNKGEISAKFITNSPTKTAILNRSEYKIDYLTNSRFLEAVDNAETKYDKKYGIEVFSNRPDYPREVVLEKMIAAREELRKSRNGFTDDQKFIVSDYAWKVGDTYINKPKAHKKGPVEGVKQVVDFLTNQAVGQEVSGEGWIAEFEIGSDEFTLYRFNTNVDSIKEGLADKERQSLTRMIFKNRLSVSAGLDLSTALKYGLIETKKMVSLELTKFKGSGKQISELNGEYLFGVDFKRHLMTRMLAFLDGFKIGIIPPGFNLNIDSLINNRDYDMEAARIPVVSDFQNAIAKWKKSLRLKETEPELLQKLKAEFIELKSIMEKPEDPSYELLDTASEASDVFIFALFMFIHRGIDIEKIIGDKAEQIGHKKLSEKYTFKDLEQIFMKDKDLPPDLSSQQLIFLLENSLDELDRLIQKKEEDKIVKQSFNIIYLSAFLIHKLGYRLEPVLVGKHHRNIHKYPPDEFTQEALNTNGLKIEDAQFIIKSLWDRSLDRPFLLAQIDSFTEENN
jgi:hypothetical protein